LDAEFDYRTFHGPLTLKCYHQHFHFKLCFEINLQIILSKTKQKRYMIPRNSCYWFL